MDRQETEQKWQDEFLGKHIDGKEIIGINVIGPPSFVYGIIKIILEDGEMFAPKVDPINSYRPSIKMTRKLIDEYRRENEV